MARLVHEIMNPEVLSVEPGVSREDALGMLQAFEVHGCPVTDDEARPVGVVTLRDLMNDDGGKWVRDRMTTPVVTVHRDTGVEEAARLLAESHLHSLIVVDDAGRTAGVVSAVDFISALVGLPVGHPPAFPHQDAVAGVEWSDDRVLDPAHTAQTPSEPGVFVLVYGGARHSEIPVWVEQARDVRARLDALLSGDVADARLAHLVARDRGRLRYRVCRVQDEAERARIAEQLTGHMRRSRLALP